MIKKILLLVLAATLSANVFASDDISDLKESIFKIAIYGKNNSRSVATAFSVRLSGKKYLVTNNHVCDSFYKAKSVSLISSSCLESLPNAKQCDLLDQITEYYIQKGTDICIMKSERSDSYPGLEFGSEKAKPSQNVLVSGFVGRSLDLMYVEGRIYGTTKIPHADILVSCLTGLKDADAISQVTCSYFTKYPTYITKTLQTGVNNIGPGFSGSPVLLKKKVIGIVSRYYPPSNGYTNGDMIIFPVDDIKMSIDNSKGNMVKTDSLDYREYFKIVAFDEAMRELMQGINSAIDQGINEILKDLND